MRLFLTGLVLLHACTVAGAQPAPGPGPFKRIPLPGIVLTDTERVELTLGADALQAEIAALARDLPPPRRALLPDVEVLHKAIDWALRYDEFFSAKEVAYARHLLDLGRERAGQLRKDRAPWLDARGLVLRGYRSKLDNSVQPYGLFVPTTLDAGETPALVFLLGRNERRTELAFLAEREAGPPQVLPANTLVLVPYGRFCNATKFAGEVDVMEALAAVRAQYRVDPNRIAVGGFSMGGGSTWHLTAHYSGLWCASTPGAGFAETPAFSKALAPGKEPRTEWEKTLWHLYDATIYAGNFFNVPTVAYSGEIDPQKQAADIMETAMAGEGLKLERLIGPQTAHKYHPDTLKILNARMEDSIAKGRETTPREIRFTTYTLRYPQSAWVRVEGMERHWDRADVKASLSDEGKVTAETKNVTALSLPGLRPKSVVLDGQTVAIGQASATAALRFAKQSGRWSLADDDGALRKRPGLTGPVDDAFMDGFIFVRPTGKPLNATVGAWVEAELGSAVTFWRHLYRGHVEVTSDKALTPEDIATKNLVLWGDPSSNAVLAQMLAQLPLRWTAQGLEVHGKTYDAGQHAPILIFPNPLNPKRYVVLNSGIDFRAEGSASNALQTPKLPDWAVVDLREAPGPRWPGRVVDAGFFDESWK